MHYSIIKNENELNRFIGILPDLAMHERFFIAFQARKKYNQSLSSRDKTQLKRTQCYKHQIVQKIRQMECALGGFLTREGDIIPEDAMVMYITPNPRDLKKATFKVVKQLLDRVETDNYFNPYADAMSAVHSTKGRSYFVHFDVDSDTDIDDKVNQVVGTVGKDAVIVIKTRGGFHVLVVVNEVKTAIKNWYTELQNILQCDQHGDIMCPIPGCIQGDFVPYLYYLKGC